MNIESNFNILKKYTLQMLNMALKESLEDQRGLRPLEEIQRFLDQSITVKTTNPKREWEHVRMLEEGG